MSTIEQQIIRWSMVAAPGLLFLGNALHPVNHNRDERDWLAGIAEHRTQWYIAHVLVFAALPLFVPAVIGLLRQLRDRRSRLADGAAFLALLSVFGTTGFVAVEGLAAWQMTAPGSSRGEMVGLLERFDETAGTFLLTGLPTFLFAVALGLLGWALVRARVEPRWASVLVVASRAIAVVIFAAGYHEGEYLMAIVAAADLLLLLGMAALRPVVVPLGEARLN
jgi:hypothetical protein